MYPGLWKLAKDEVCNHFENSCTRVYGNWSKMKFVIFSKIRVPGSMKIGKTWSLIFFWKFIYRVYKKWLKLKSMIFLKIHVPRSKKLGKNEVCNHFENSCTLVYGNWSNMKFVNFSKNHVPGSMKIGKKWILIFLKKFTYPGLWKLVKNEVCDFFKNSCTWGYENWPKINFDILLEIHVPGSTKIG